MRNDEALRVKAGSSCSVVGLWSLCRILNLHLVRQAVLRPILIYSNSLGGVVVEAAWVTHIQTLISSLLSATTVSQLGVHQASPEPTEIWRNCWLIVQDTSVSCQCMNLSGRWRCTLSGHNIKGASVQHPQVIGQSYGHPKWSDNGKQLLWKYRILSQFDQFHESFSRLKPGPYVCIVGCVNDSSQSERQEKALRVELVCFDLTLSVAPKDYTAAIASVWLRLFTGPIPKLWVRMNHAHMETYKQMAQV